MKIFLIKFKIIVDNFYRVMVKYNQDKEREINTSRLRNDNNNAQS